MSWLWAGKGEDVERILREASGEVVRRMNSSRGDPIRLPGRKVHLTMTLAVTVIEPGVG